MVEVHCGVWGGFCLDLCAGIVDLGLRTLLVGALYASTLTRPTRRTQIDTVYSHP